MIGTDLGEKSISLTSVPLTKPTILVLGNEGHGIRTNILKRCTHLVRIPGGGHSGSTGTWKSTTGTGSVGGVADGTSTGESGVETVDVESGDVGGSDVSEVVRDDQVDSLNVSVTGGIILHHLMSARNNRQ